MQSLFGNEGPAGNPRIHGRHARPDGQFAATAERFSGLFCPDCSKPARGPRADDGAVGNAFVPWWVASPFGCLFGFLCVTSAPVRGWVIDGGSLPGKDSSSASSRFASSSAFCALVLAFLFMGTSPVRHSALNRELRSVARIIPPFLSCENAYFTISKSALWTRLRSAYARCSFQGWPQRLLSFPWVL